MKAPDKPTTCNILAIICGLWFLLAGWVWVYYINVVTVFPFAIAGFFLWRAGRAQEYKTLNRVAGWLLAGGLLVSLGALVMLLVKN
ncbi:MAG: hypothetical protein KA250_11010 [Verrucomicrobiales bacterium]|jgi:hypothetical protein|nr:hypothetical protein [Verrucomicrobiales bacterium]MBP9225654.1 hypothetical protein [Verrucomicrobiales bacterium]HQZ26871.1 hypothetical protein [Verrucomicrobiales bacterium]